MIDVSDETAVLLDGLPVAVSLIRALAVPGVGYVHVEADDGSVEGVEIRREGEAIHFQRLGVSGKGTEAKPAATHFRADLRGPKGAREWVQRGSARHLELQDLGWTESGATRPAVVPTDPRQTRQ